MLINDRDHNAIFKNFLDPVHVLDDASPSASHVCVRYSPQPGSPVSGTRMTACLNSSHGATSWGCRSRRRIATSPVLTCLEPSASTPKSGGSSLLRRPRQNHCRSLRRLRRLPHQRLSSGQRPAEVGQAKCRSPTDPSQARLPPDAHSLAPAVYPRRPKATAGA